MTDSNKNKLAGAYMTQVTFTKDTTKPAYQKFEVKKDSNKKATGITLTFSEDIGKTSNAGVVVVNQDVVLKRTPSLVIDKKDAKSVDVTFAGVELEGQKYTISFPAGAFEDVAGNKADAFTVTVDFGAVATDNSPVKVERITGTTVAGSANVITVSFPEKVTVSAVNTANYTLNGYTLPAGTTIYLDETQKKATITLPAGSVASKDRAPLVISGVVTTSGKTVETTIQLVDVVDDTPAKIASTQVIGNQIFVTFTEDIDFDSVTVASAKKSFVIKDNEGKDNTITVEEVGSTADKKIISLTVTVPTGKTIASVSVNDGATITGTDKVAISK